MNPDQPSREQIEARITALLLGELPADEAALLRYTIAQDTALQTLHDQLQSALPLVREAAKHPADAPAEKPAPLKLSADRREKLLAHFKIPRPQAPQEPLFWLRLIRTPTLIEALVVVAIIAILSAMMLPSLSRAKMKSHRVMALNEARQKALEAQIAEEDKRDAMQNTPAAPQLNGPVPAEKPSATAPSGLQFRTWSADNGPREAMKANADKTVAAGHNLSSDAYMTMTNSGSADSPQIVTLAPEPQIAPPPPALVPPTQIVLPQPESTPEIAAQSGIPANTKEGGVESQNVVGYVNLPLGGQTLAATPAPAANTAPPALYPGAPIETTAGQLAVNNTDGEQPRTIRQGLVQQDRQWVVPSQAIESNGAGASSGGTYLWSIGGAGGGGGSGGTSHAAGGPISGYRNGTLADAGKDRLLDTTNSVALAWDDSGVNRSREENLSFGLQPAPETTPKGSFTLTQSPKAETQTSADRRYYHKAARQPEEAENKNLPVVATAEPAFQNSTLASAPPPAQMPAPATLSAPVVADTFSANLAPATVTADHGLHVGGVTLGTTGDTSKTSPTTGEPSWAGTLNNPDTPPGPNNHFVNRYAYAGKTPIALDQVQSTNYMAINSGANNTFNPGVSAITPEVTYDLTPQDKLGVPQLPRLEQQYLEQSNEIQLAEGKVETARRDLHIIDSDSNAAAPTPTINGRELQMINGQMVEGKKIYDEELVQLKELKSMAKTNKEELLDVLPQMVPDATLNDLLSKRHEARQNLVMLTNDYSVNNNAVTQTKSSIDELNHKIDDRVTGIMASLDSQVSAKKASLDAMDASVEETKQKGEQEAKKNEPYYAAKIDLEQKRRMHELLYSKLEAEKLDLGIPNSSMVQLTDPAEPGKSQNMWQRLTGQVESTARIKIENDVIDITSLSAAPAVASSGYDPYFIQTTFEIMQSEPVLGKVVDALDLQSTWAKNNGGEKLNRNQAIELLKQRLDLQPVKNTKLISISAKSDDPQEAANIANAVAKAYTEYRVESRQALTTNGVAVLEDRFTKQTEDIRAAQTKVERLGKELTSEQSDLPLRKPAPNTPLPQPEILTSSNAFSTFSLNVSDVSFKLAEASLENGKLPDTASIRSEEFINAFDYRDPESAPGQPMAFTSERAAYPFAHNRDLLRFSIKTAAAGRQEGRPLNLVLLLDTSGSMERADRVQIIHEALRVLATQLHENDIVSVVSFARTARLWADGVSGGKAGETLDKVGSITPEGGTNLEEAMRLAYETAHRHYLANGMNRVVLLTDGAANLGNVDPGALKEKVEAQRKQGIALDCFGIGWEDLNDDLLEELSSNGDGRYAFLNSPEDASKDFAAKLAGALQVAAQDVKVQVEFNPQRVISYRQIGYAKHQLTKRQFRDNTVAAGEIAAQEAGNALYTVETNPNGDGPIATVHVRYRIPGTQDYHEHSWDVAYTGNAPALDLSSPAMRLAATASAFSEWLAASPYAQEVTPDALAKYLSGVPEVYGADDRPKQLETMIREAKSLEGK